jgi:hypothetical protein
LDVVVSRLLQLETKFFETAIGFSIPKEELADFCDGLFVPGDGLVEFICHFHGWGPLRLTQSSQAGADREVFSVQSVPSRPSVAEVETEQGKWSSRSAGAAGSSVWK